MQTGYRKLRSINKFQFFEEYIVSDYYLFQILSSHINILTF